MIRTLSVGTRWALLYTVVTLVALSIPIGFIYGSVEHQLRRDTLLLLDSYLSEVRVELENHPADAPRVVSIFTRRLNRISPDVDYGAALVAADGSAGFRVGSLERSGVHGSALQARALLPGGGVLEAAISDRSVSRGMGRIRWALLVAAPLVLLLSGLCGAWLARRSLRPIAQMTASARRIGGENLADRIPLRGTDDELDRLAATLNGMFDRLTEAMERLRGFSADAAHQLKSPLSAMQNEIEAALEGGEVGADTKQLLDGLLAQVGELTGCVSAMLRLARSESGLSEGQAAPVDLAQLLDGVASLFHPLADQRGIALELGEVAPIEVHGDVAWLRELFANLVQNAIAHTPAGGRVGIALTTEPEQVSIAISDTGDGIDPSDQKRIFDRFYRISPSRGVPGSGLGLALAKQIAVAHGGSIDVQSRTGGGSVFTVRLPHRDRGPRASERPARREEPVRLRRDVPSERHVVALSEHAGSP